MYITAELKCIFIFVVRLNIHILNSTTYARINELCAKKEHSRVCRMRTPRYTFYAGNVYASVVSVCVFICFAAVTAV